jgi:mono/diheme cytochrome c family protein
MPHRFRTSARAAAILALLLAVPAVPLCAAGADPVAVTGLLDQYRKAGAADFDAAWAKDAWTKEFPAEGGKTRSCITCHGSDLTKPGRHAKTGKVIDPMARSVNPDRYTDMAKIEKWFKRNCEWAWGRLCTPREKGSFLLFLKDT